MLNFFDELNSKIVALRQQDKKPDRIYMGEASYVHMVNQLKTYDMRYDEDGQIDKACGLKIYRVWNDQYHFEAF